MLANYTVAGSPARAPGTAGLAGPGGPRGAGREEGAGLRPDAGLAAARDREVVLGRVRAAVAALAVVMAAGRPGFSPVVAAGFLLVPVAGNPCVRAALRRARTQAAVRRLGRRVLAADTAVTLAAYLMFLRDPHALPAAFVPLLAFEIALRFGGWRGIAGSVAVFSAAVGVRVLFQLRFIPGGALRWPLLLVWVLLGAVIVLLSRELRAQARLRLAAQHDRERIAESFQAVVGEVLTRSGVPPQAATWDDVLAAVRRLCDEQPAECATLASGIADLLVPAVRDFGLTRREQEIARLLGMGYGYDRIARTLFISASTVRNHVFNIRSKLSLSSREEIAAFARDRGLAPPPPDSVTAAAAAGDRGS